MPDTVALLFGAAIVAVYSYDRFNRVSYEGGRQLERLVTLLTPDKLRARRVVFNGYLFYVFTLLLIYFFLCAYAEVLPVLGGPDLTSDAIGASELPVAPAEATPKAVTGFIPGSSEALWTQTLAPEPQTDALQGRGGIGIDPSVSLTVALIIVGLAPTFPILRRFEDWMRSAAHHLAGIPTRVIHISEELRHRDLPITGSDGPNNQKKSTQASDGPVPPNTLLIPRGDWERMALYRSSAEGQMTAPDDFRRDMEIVFAFSSWLLDRKLKLAGVEGRERFDQLESELRNRRDSLILALDEKSGYRPGGTIAVVVSDEDPVNEQVDAEHSEVKRASWERLARDADELADDLCILIALYVEHELIDFEHEPVASSRNSIRRQQTLVQDVLEDFLSPVLSHESDAVHVWSHAVLVWLWTLGVVLTISVLWGIWPGGLETAMQRGEAGDSYWRMLTYASTAFNSYCVPLLVALAIHDGALHAHHWRRMWSAHWTARLPQAALLVFSSWIVATLFFVGLVLWLAAIDQGGFTTDSANFWSNLRLRFEYNAPTSLRGAILALILVILLDAWAERSSGGRSSGSGALSSWRWSIVSAVIMAFLGAGTRWMSSWSSAAASGRSALDEIDRGLIVYAALQSAIIGFFVVFCVSQALINHSRSTSRLRGRHRETAAPAE